MLVATLFGAGAAGLADAGVKRLAQVAPQVLETIQRVVKATGQGSEPHLRVRQGIAQLRDQGQAAQLRDQGQRQGRATRRLTLSRSTRGAAVGGDEPVKDETAHDGAVSEVPPPGIEPGTFGLRVRCSAS